MWQIARQQSNNPPCQPTDCSRYLLGGNGGLRPDLSTCLLDWSAPVSNFKFSNSGGIGEKAGKKLKEIGGTPTRMYITNISHQSTKSCPFAINLPRINQSTNLSPRPIINSPSPCTFIHIQLYTSIRLNLFHFLSDYLTA